MSDATRHWLEETLLEAGRAIRSLKKASPDGYNSFWPEFDDTYKSLQPMKIPVDVDLADQVIGWMCDGPLDEMERRVIGYRYLGGRTLSWRKVGKRLGMSHEHARSTGNVALLYLANWLKTKRD